MVDISMWSDIPRFLLLKNVLVVLLGGLGGCPYTQPLKCTYF